MPRPMPPSQAEPTSADVIALADALVSEQKQEARQSADEAEDAMRELIRITGL